MEGSIVSFMFGSKLAVFTKKLEKIECSDLPGYGPVKYVGGKPVGVLNFDQREGLESQKYSEIISRLTHYLEMSLGVLEDLNITLRTVMNSETYKYSRRAQNLRLVPEFITGLNLRVFTKPDNREMATIHDMYKTVTYDFEKTAFQKANIKTQNKDFAIIYANPKIGGKYSLIANIYYILEFESGVMDKQIEFVNKSATEYELLLRGLLDGLNKHYTLDEEDEFFLNQLREHEERPVDLIEMEKFFVFLDAIDQRLELLSDTLNRKAEAIEQYKNFVNSKKGAFNRQYSFGDQQIDKDLVEKSQKEQLIESLKEQEQKIKQELRILVQRVHMFNVNPSVEERLAAKGVKVKISRDRYYKPIIVENVDTNLYREKYRTNLTNYVDITRTKYYNAEFFKNAEQDPTMLQWIKPPDLYAFDIKEARVSKPEDLFVDPIIIPNEEREKELLRSEISKTMYFKKINK